MLDKETAATAALFDEDVDSDEDADQETRHDFSTVLDDVDELLLKLTQSQPAESKELKASSKLPQIDGADDRLQRTPIKSISSKSKSSPSKTPTTPIGQKSLPKSPRTPKTSAAKKYAPLALTIGSSSSKSG